MTTTARPIRSAQYPGARYRRIEEDKLWFLFIQSDIMTVLKATENRFDQESAEGREWLPKDHESTSWSTCSALMLMRLITCIKVAPVLQERLQDSLIARHRWFLRLDCSSLNRPNLSVFLTGKFAKSIQMTEQCPSQDWEGGARIPLSGCDHAYWECWICFLLHIKWHCLGMVPGVRDVWHASVPSNKQPSESRLLFMLHNLWKAMNSWSLVLEVERTHITVLSGRQSGGLKVSRYRVPLLKVAQR